MEHKHKYEVVYDMQFAGIYAICYLENCKKKLNHEEIHERLYASEIFMIPTPAADVTILNTIAQINVAKDKILEDRTQGQYRVLSRHQIQELYNEAKELYDLCWDEVKRGRRE